MSWLVAFRNAAQVLLDRFVNAQFTPCHGPSGRSQDLPRPRPAPHERLRSRSRTPIAFRLPPCAAMHRATLHRNRLWNVCAYHAWVLSIWIIRHSSAVTPRRHHDAPLERTALFAGRRSSARLRASIAADRNVCDPLLRPAAYTTGGTPATHSCSGQRLRGSRFPPGVRAC